MIQATVHRLTKLQYTDEFDGAFRLYVYPDEQITIEEAKRCAEMAMARGREVRITNGGDNLVFHAKDGKVLWPKAGAEEFWKRVETLL
jgi:hypothetical protein